MPYGSALDTAAARSAIARGDDLELARYLREGGNNPVQNCTGATANLIPGTNLYNRSTGISGTLPLATGSQDVVRVVVQTAIASGSGVVKVARAADTMIGMLTYGTVTFAASSSEAAGGTDDTITLTATAGGLQGTIINLTDIAPNLWLVDGVLASSTSATVLSAGV